ncbi:MAG: hypothetical protein K2N30_04950, partial [Clostridia bacterium]|nr:hypothetical protein [Clostridia bacterium]
SEHCIGVWLGDKDNKRSNITGGGNSCEYLKAALEKLYESHTPKRLDVTSGTSTVEIDAEEYYSNNRIILADEISPKLNKLQVKVLQGCEPKEQSNRFTSPEIQPPSISVKNNTVNISLCQTKYYAYLVKRYKNSNFEVIYDGNWKESISDEPESGLYTYTVTPYFLNGENKIFGKEITLPNVNVSTNGNSPQIKIPDIAEKDWFNL